VLSVGADGVHGSCYGVSVVAADIGGCAGVGYGNVKQNLFAVKLW
jgi:hypothetical protein